MNSVETARVRPERLRLGLIGIGNHMKENLLPALGDVAGTEIVAVSSRDEAKSNLYAQRFNHAEQFSDWRQLITSGIVDGVVIAATPELHEEAIQACLESGIHCYVEKPPARDKVTLQHLVEVEAARSPTVCFIGFNYRFADGYRLLSQLTGSSQGPKASRLRFISSKPRRPWLGFATVEESYLFGVAIHALDLVITRFGSPDHVTAQWTTLSPDCFSLDVNMRFANGRGCALAFGNYSNRFEFDIEDIVGASFTVILRDQTTIELIDQPISVSDNLFGGKDYKMYHLPSSRGGHNRAGYTGALSSFAESIRNNLPSASPLKACLPIYEAMSKIIHVCPAHL